MITGIIVALPEELSTLTKKKIDQGCCQFISEKIVVALSGSGPKNAESATNLLISQGAGGIISWGCAAALDESLKPGDLTLADNLVAGDQTRLSIQSTWRQHTFDALSRQFVIHTGTLAESHQIVSSSQEKLALQNKTKARVLDMESFASAKKAAQASLPFIAIRAISDPVKMDLPVAISHSVNKNGTVDLRKLILFLLLHPLQLPGLVKLGFYFHAATNKLKLVAGLLDIIADFDQPGFTAQ